MSSMGASEDRRAAKPRAWARVAELGWFFAGAALADSFLMSVLPVASVPVAAALLTAVWASRELVTSERRLLRALGVAAWALAIAAHAFWAYLIAAWGPALAWSVPLWGWAVVGVAAAGSAITLRWPLRGARVPIVLAMGAFVTLCLRGWSVEEDVVRCDDYLAVRSDDAMAIVSVTANELEHCSAGATVGIGRYPRAIWQTARGDRTFVTTQPGPSGPSTRPSRFDGSVCELEADGDPTCVGAGKAQHLAEAEPLGRIFAGSWGRFGGGARGELLALDREGPLRVVERLRTRTSMGGVIYDGEADRLYGVTDEGGEVIPIVASTLRRERPLRRSLTPPGGMVYDETRHEGVLCSAGALAMRLDGSTYLAVALRGDRLRLRPLGGSSWLTSFSLTWGCDFDPASRRVYSAIPNLGLLATLDYDTGAILRTDFVGFGMRSVTVDRARRRVYLTRFLAGEVVAIDLRSGSEVARWRVGRFPRFATIARDGRSLYVGTNVGVIAIDLGEAG